MRRKNKFSSADWIQFRRLMVYLRPHRGRLSIAMIAIVVGSLLSLAGPFALQFLIDAVFTLDASYGYTLKDVIGTSTTLRVGVINLLDTDPSAVDVLGGFDPSVHDPRGRTCFVRLTQEF